MDPEAKAKLLSEFQNVASSKSEAASQAPSMIENLIIYSSQPHWILSSR